MLTTRRKFLSSVLFSAIGTTIASKFNVVQARNRTSKVEQTTADFLMEWAKLAEWRMLRTCAAGPMHNAVLLAMSRKYVKDYYDTCGQVPTGAHRVRYRCGTDRTNDVHVNCCGESRIFDEVITYLGGSGLAIHVLKK